MTIKQARKKLKQLIEQQQAECEACRHAPTTWSMKTAILHGMQAALKAITDTKAEG